MGAKIGGGGGPQADINITPLVDVVLVLLIIFMVIAPMLTKHIPVKVPQKQQVEKPKEDDKEKKQLVLKLFADGNVELNKEAIKPEDLGATLKGRLSPERNVVFFEAEDDANYGRAVLLLDIVKSEGAIIGIKTPKKEDPNAAPALGPDGLPLPPAEGGEGAPAPAPTEAPE